MLLSELQKQKKTKNIKCRIKKKKKKARRLFIKFMKQIIAAKFGDCTYFRYYPATFHGIYYKTNEFLFYTTDKCYHVNVNFCYRIADVGVSLPIQELMSVEESKELVQFANRIYHLYTKTDYLDLKRRATEFLLCNLRNKEFPKGVDKIIAQKITIF